MKFLKQIPAVEQLGCPPLDSKAEHLTLPKPAVPGAALPIPGAWRAGRAQREAVGGEPGIHSCLLSSPRICPQEGT